MAKINSSQIQPQEAWKTPSFVNGWVDYGSAFGSPGYYKDSLGNVHIRGLIKSGTSSTGTTMFTLPVGYRPSLNYIFTCPKVGGDYYELRVLTSGAVAVGDRVASPTWSSIAVTFRAEQ